MSFCQYFVNNGQVITYGANGSDFHGIHEQEMLKKDPNYNSGDCIRRENHTPSGQNYEMCEGCDTKNHTEPSAINKIVNTPKFSFLYVWTLLFAVKTVFLK